MQGSCQKTSAYISMGGHFFTLLCINLLTVRPFYRASGQYHRIICQQLQACDSSPLTSQQAFIFCRSSMMMHYEQAGKGEAWIWRNLKQPATMQGQSAITSKVGCINISSYKFCQLLASVYYNIYFAQSFVINCIASQYNCLMALYVIQRLAVAGFGSSQLPLFRLARKVGLAATASY